MSKSFLTSKFSKALRRLVIAGKDTPENLRLIFGPGWQNIFSEWKKARMTILLDAPVGSPDYKYKIEYDEKSLVPSSRPATEMEAAEVQMIREMQRAIREQLGWRKEPTPMDMTDILRTYGAVWEQMVPKYYLATATMDQGLSVPDK